MAKHWIVEGTRTRPSEKRGERVRCVVESQELSTRDEARLFGAGQLRGMGYVVTDVQVVEQLSGAVVSDA